MSVDLGSGGDAGAVKPPPSPRDADGLSAWRLDRRGIALFLVTLAAGAALGFIMFRLSGGGGDGWPITVIRTEQGWRLSSPAGLQQSVVGLDDAHLLWQNGGCLQTVDLADGRVISLQSPIVDAQGHQIGADSASVSGDYAAWAMPDVSGAKEELFVRDLRSGDQQTIATAAWIESASTSDGRVAWQQGDTLFCHDMSSGRTTVVRAAHGGLIGMAWPLLAWTTLEGKTGQPQKERVTAHVRDLITGSTLEEPIGRLDTLDALTLAGGSLIYQLEHRVDKTHDSLQLVIVDCTSGRRSLATQECSQFVSDSRSVAWIGYRRGAARVQRLGGGPVTRSLQLGRFMKRVAVTLMSTSWIAGVPQAQDTAVDVTRRGGSAAP
jgi:hypothetical protein